MKAKMPMLKSALGAGLAAVLLMTMLVATAVPAVAMNVPASRGFTPAVTPADALDPLGSGGGDALLQFTSGGHVLGFSKEAVYLAGLDHALRVEFSGGRPVQPIGESADMAQSGIAELGKVSYMGVWEHIDAIFSAVAGGIAESTYIIHPGGDPVDISLHYNVPVEITPQGGLRLSFGSGYMTESPPVAWQEIDGKRRPVEVQLQLRAESQVGFTLGNYDASHTIYIDPVYQWHTFYGSSAYDAGYAIAVDSSANIYVAGGSGVSWNGPGGQLPLNPHSGGSDIVVVKLDTAGAYQWHTFYGSSGDDQGTAIALDSSANLYVVGYSDASWNGPGGQLPLNHHADGWEIVVVKLDTAGAYQWHTFYGSSSTDFSSAIAMDSSANVYVAGRSEATWSGPGGQLPLNPHAGGWEIVVVKLDTSGAYQWHTFYGSSSTDGAADIAVDSAANIYVAGRSEATWSGPGGQLPLNPHAGGWGIVVVKLDTAGAYQWHTFYGSSSTDEAADIAVDSAANIYVAGNSVATWSGPGGQLPLNPHAGDEDIVVVKLDTAGAYQWHTFYGSWSTDYGYAIALDCSANLYVVGYSDASWNGPGGQLPLNPHAGDEDIVVVKLDTTGAYRGHAFYGSSSGDRGRAVAMDTAANVYLAGGSGASWSGPGGQLPLNPHSGGSDIVVVKLSDTSPTVTTLAASDVTDTAATLNMSYTLGGFSAVDVRFAYKKSADSDWTETSWVATPGSPHTLPVSGLDSNTTYDFKAQLKHNSNVIEGSTLQFATGSATACIQTEPGTGMTCLTASHGTIEDLQAVAAVSPAPRGVDLPHGMFEFKITGLAEGATVTLTIELPEAVPVGTVWWKYQDGSWYSLPNESDDGDNIMTIKFTDGGLGDSPESDPGTIVDPGGPGNPVPPLTVGWEGSAVNKAAVVAPWMALLAAIAGASLLVLRRRRAQS